MTSIVAASTDWEMSFVSVDLSTIVDLPDTELLSEAESVPFTPFRTAAAGGLSSSKESRTVLIANGLLVPIMTEAGRLRLRRVAEVVGEGVFRGVVLLLPAELPARGRAGDCAMLPVVVKMDGLLRRCVSPLRAELVELLLLLVMLRIVVCGISGDAGADGVGEGYTLDEISSCQRCKVNIR